MSIKQGAKTDRHRRKLSKLLLSGTFLLMGTSIYLVFRRNVWFLSWISLWSVPSTEMEESVCVLFLKYSLPDGLWYASLLLFQTEFMGVSMSSRFVTGLCIILPFIWEIFQLLDILPGTFDPLDIAAYTLTLIVISCFHFYHQKHGS